ncbi:hypothetical protein J0H58_21595 [bacterium]|nr:hypothetical protein [bacterium]
MAGLGTGGSSGGASSGDVKAGAAYWLLYAKDGVTGALDKLQKKFAGVSASLGKAAAVTGAAGAALLAPVAALFTAGVDRAADLQRLADSLGAPVEQLSRLQYAADQAKVSLDEVMANPARFRGLIDRAPVVDEATGRKAVETQRQMADAWLALQNSLLPLLDVVLPLVQGFAGLAKQFGPLLLLVAGVGAGLAATGAAAAGLSAIFGALAVGTGVVSTVLGAVLSPIGLLVTAIAAAGVAFLTLTESGQQFVAFVGSGLTSVVGTAQVAGQGIKDALAVGDIGLGWRIALAGLKLEWSKLVVYLTAGWNGFKGFFVDGWHGVVMGLQLAWNGFSYWWEDFWLGLFKWLNDQFGTKLAPLFRMAAEAAEAVGVDGSGFRLAADTAGAGLGNLIDRARAQANKDFQDRNDRIITEAGDAQLERERARDQDLNEAIQDVVQAQRELADLTAEAADRAAKRPGNDGRDVLPNLGKLIARGAFGGPLGQQFGANNTFERKQTDLLTNIRDDIRAIRPDGGDSLTLT